MEVEGGFMGCSRWFYAQRGMGCGAECWARCTLLAASKDRTSSSGEGRKRQQGKPSLASKVSRAVTFDKDMLVRSNGMVSDPWVLG